MKKEIKMEKIFSYNSSIYKTAYMNWNMMCDPDNTPHNLYFLALGYSCAVEELVTSIWRENRDKKADLLIFPIFFSINHAIELFLKAIILQLQKLNCEESKCQNTHDIGKLYSDMVDSIQKKEHDKGGLEQHLQDVKQYIDELYIKIKKADDKTGSKTKLRIDFSRYPNDSKGEKQFYIHDGDNEVVDIDSLIKRFEKIKDELDGLYCKYDVEIERKFADENEKS